MTGVNDIISSKGPFNNFYSKKKTETQSSEKEIIYLITNSYNLIFIRIGSSNKINDLQHFSNNLDKLNRPVILITSDGDRNVPSSYTRNTIYNILNSNYIKKWYTQNYDMTIIHPKLKHFPIGFDLHTSNWLIYNDVKKKIDFMVDKRINSPTNKRISNKIFTDTHFSFSHPERRYLYNILKNNEFIHFSPCKKSFTDITNDYNKYNFVISPRGNGLDCHRTWELFLAGVIVITKTSSLDYMYTNNNLPVVILKNWEELNDLSIDKINKWYKNNINKTDINNIFPKLTYKYWIK